MRALPRWHEVGTECQYFENTLRATSNATVEQAFHTDYGVLPYEMTFIYEPTDTPGVFQKHARGPRSRTRCRLHNFQCRLTPFQTVKR